MADPAVAEAVRLAKRVAAGDADAAREVVAAAVAEQAHQAEKQQTTQLAANIKTLGPGWLLFGVKIDNAYVKFVFTYLVTVFFYVLGRN